MKKYTSAALLAIRLTWLAALAFTLTGTALQIFFAFRELMPGGVPLQVTFGFEHLLRSAAEKIGKFWMVLMMYNLASTAGSSKGSKSVYTMNRLGLSEHQMMLVFGLVFTGYFLLYWAFQLSLCYGLFVFYSRYALVSSNAWMLACWRSEWLHTLLPLNEWWGYLRNIVICLTFGFTAAFDSQRQRRGKHSLVPVIPPVLCLFLLNGQVGQVAPAVALTVLLVIFIIFDWFALRGGRKDEDL